jgi:hypothetical protein
MSTIHKNQNVKITIKCSIASEWERQIIHSHNEILYSNENGQVTTSCDRNESHNGE